MDMQGRIQTWRALFWAGLIIAMTVLAYIPAMQGGFIWDDDDYVTRNATLQGLDGLRKIWLEPSASPQYYPIVFTSFWVQYQIGGLDPFNYHLVNVLLHAVNAVLVWLVLRRLGVPGAWMAAAIFALHPVHVESAAWITERKNVLSGFFYLSCLLIFVRIFLWDKHQPEATPSQRPYQPLNIRAHVGSYLLGMVLFACALLSKSVTCSLPAVILLLLWWKRDQIRWRDGLALVPLVLLGAVSATTTAWLEKVHVGAHGEEWAFSILERCLIAGRAVWFYAGKLIWPQNLTFIYPRWHIDAAMWWQYVYPLSAMAIVVTLWLMKRRIGKGPLAAALIFGGTLLPALGFVNFYPMRFSFVADHFQYLASIAFITLCVAAAMKMVQPGSPNAMRVEYALSAILLIILGMLVWQEGYKYRDLEALSRNTIARNPQCWMAYSLLGAARAEQGKMDEAIAYYRRSLEIKPDYEIAHFNLGLALETQGHLEQAIHHYSEASRIDSNFPGIRYVQGLVLQKQGKTAQAIAKYRDELRMNPDFYHVHLQLANTLRGQGNHGEAIKHYSEALRINPNSVEACMNLAGTLKQAGQIDAAIRRYTDVISLSPGFAGAHINLGNALLETGEFNEAIAHYTEALRIHPDSAGVHMNLGNAFFGRGDLTEAIHHYSEALRIRPDLVGAHDNLNKLLSAQAKIQADMTKIQQALKRDPANSLLHYQLGNLYNRLGDVDRAAGQYKNALSIKPDFPQALNSLAAMHMARNEYDEAISVLQKFLGLRPKSPESYYNIACLYAKQHKIKESVNWLNKAIKNGYKNWSLIRTDPDLEAVRGSSYYDAMITGQQISD